MSTRLTQFSILVAALLVLPQEGFGQFEWEITRPPDTGLSANSMLFGLSCKGQNFTACGLAEEGYRILLFRSNDAGKTWVTQDPGLDASGAANGSSLKRVYQIDSLNVVAIGGYRSNGNLYDDSAITIRTTDAGKTWQTQYSTLDTSTHNYQAVHFSDSAHGILVGGQDVFVALTSDGGSHWNRTPFRRTQQWFGFNACHAYGGGRYSAFCGSSVANKVFTTLDSWNTVDSGETLPDSIVRFGRKCVSFTDRCVFSAGGLVIAYGTFRGHDTIKIIQQDTFHVSGADTSLLFRSTDFGKTWSAPIIDTSGPGGTFTALDNDSIFALGNYGIVMSTDKGLSWKEFPYNAPDIWGSYTNINRITNLQLARGTDLVATVSQAYYSHSMLMHGSIERAGVAPIEGNEALDAVYPNPATSFVKIRGQSVSIFDALGRSCSVPNHDGTLDVSSLPAGVYYVSNGKQRNKFLKE